MIPKSILFLLLSLSAASAATLEVGAGKAFSTIQAAVDAAAPGDVIQVAPGLYVENVVASVSPLTLSGARAGTSARERIGGAPDPAVESILSAAVGTALSLVPAGGSLVVDGFVLESPASEGSGVVTVAGTPGTGLVLSNNLIRVTGTAAGSALLLEAAAEDAMISGNVITLPPEAAYGVRIEGADAYAGFHFVGNDVIRDGGRAGSGFSAAVPLTKSPARPVRIAGNRLAGHQTGFHSRPGGLREAEIEFNEFEGNDHGMTAGPHDCLISGNRWEGNEIAGLVLTAGGDVTDGDAGARRNRIEENDFISNGGSANPSGHGDLVYDDQADVNAAENLIRRNHFGSAVGVFNADPGVTVDARYNRWAETDDPGVVGAVEVTPWYQDDALTILSHGGASLSGDVVIGSGESLQGGTLSLTAGATLVVGQGGSLEISGDVHLSTGASLTIRGGSASLGKITAEPGAVIDVENGDLSLDPLGIGQSHTLAGSFTFFNCLGSLHIHANTTFSGSTLGLASDIHVTPGVTLVVLGSLVLDGCILDSSGTFFVLVNSGATFRMVRCEVTGAFVTLVGSDVHLRDNIFRDTAITAFSTVSGAEVFHNVFIGGIGALSLLPGASVITTSEGWGNVADLSDVKNQLSLAFRAPVDPTRTLDGDGILYVQPGDPVAGGIDIGNLHDKAQAVEVLLGFSTDHLQGGTLSPSATWANGLYESADSSSTIGRFNSAIGLGFSHPDPDGTLLDSTVADVLWTTTSLEGLTRIFFREKSPADEPLIDTRITASDAGIPYFREAPFTRNSPNLVVDGTIPEIEPGGSAVQVRDGDPLDVLLTGNITRQGVVTVTFDARDLLAGIDEEDVWVEFASGAFTTSGAAISSSPVVIGGEQFTRYICEITVDASAPNGIHEVRARVMDRSGNEAMRVIGYLEVQKNRITATVAPQGLVTAPITRDVVFIATASGGAVLATWTVPVGFSGGIGTAVLEEVPEGTVNLSAKMAWNLRRRLPAVLDVTGQGVVSFTGAAQLPGGDLNGNNLINSGDYNLLSFSFPGVNPVADITGNGVVNSGDYNILVLNWLTAGDPP